MDTKAKHEQNTPMNRRIVLTHTEEIHAPAGKVLPLLCPVAEYDWIENWDCRLVFTKSGVNEEGCTFTEGIMGPGLTGSPMTTTWLTNRYDVESRRIQFIIFLHDQAVIRYNIRLDEVESGLTTAVMNFEITVSGSVVGSLSDEEIRSRANGIVTFISGMLKHYCENGRMMETV